MAVPLWAWTLRVSGEPEFWIQSESGKSQPVIEKRRDSSIRDFYSSRRPRRRPIRRFASDVNPDLAKASRHWTRPFIRVDTCVPGKGSFQRQRGKSAQDAFREAQFLRERHSSRLRSVFHVVVLGTFFREIGFVQRRFLQLLPAIAMSIVRRRGRKKTLVKDAPRPSRRGMRTSKKAARTRRLNGDANCTRG